MTNQAIKSGCNRCFRALSAKVRLEIVNILHDGRERNVSEVVSRFKLTQPTVSYHLSELQKAGLLTTRIEGRNVFYKMRVGCPHNYQRCILK